MTDAKLVNHVIQHTQLSSCQLL